MKMYMLPSIPAPIASTLAAPARHAGLGPWPKSALPAPETQPLRALIVEDQPEDVELMEHALRQNGFEVQPDVVQDEEQFLELIHKNQYDVILADYNLPRWNGMEAVSVLRREGLDVPVLVVTGALGEVKAVECLKNGASDYILKDHLTRLPASVRRSLREKQLREDNRRSHEELARSNRDLEQFAYVASHDLQEPLRMIAAYTELLGERYRGQLDANADKYIGYVVDGAKRMQALIEAILSFSRVGREGLQLQNTDCNLLVETAKKNLEAAIAESGASVSHDRLPVVVADTQLLAQVFQNLIGNALKFRGQAPPRIRLAARKQNQEWTFSVADNGIGIAPEHAQTIFAIFKRLHTHAEYPGSGIGLSICKKIVEQHGGRIWVESEPGKGSTFHFVLPCLAPTGRLQAGL
jgi:two-component system, sensor histidine kinase and response regulator